MVPTVKALRSSQVFANLSDRDLEAIAETFQRQIFTKGTRVLTQDQEIDFVGLILQGTAQLVLRDPGGRLHACGNLQAGDFIVDTSLFWVKLR